MNEGNAGTAKTPEKPGEVWITMDELSNAIDRLDASVSRLNEKTTRVCSSANPLERDGTEKEPSCELSGYILSQVSKVKTLTEILNSINDRMEI